MKIASFLMFDKFQEDYLQEKLPEHEHFFYQQMLTEKNVALVKEAEIITLWVYSQVTREIINQLPNLKYITIRGTGFNHVDLEAAAKKNILVSNVPEYGSDTVAEYAFAHLLNLTRKISFTDARMGQEPVLRTELMGVDLNGKTLGVIGVGRIGQHAVRIGLGFGMRVVGYDPYPNEEFAQQTGFQYLPLEEVLKQADFITIHARLTDGTYHIINDDNYSYLKKGVYIVNTSRGPILNTETIIKGLAEGIIAGAGLDVFEGDEFVRFEDAWFDPRRIEQGEEREAGYFSKLLEYNVVLTPHNAYNTKEAVINILDTTVQNITAFIQGKPINLVRLESK